MHTVATAGRRRTAATDRVHGAVRSGCAASAALGMRAPFRAVVRTPDRAMKSFHRRTARTAPQPAPRAPAAAHAGPRADQLLVERGLAASRSVAQRLIEAGRVIGPQGPLTKASQVLPGSAELQVLPDDTDRFVSRGGVKLAGALARTGLEVRGKACLDVGQSTGGFTDCLLQAGAGRVVGVDVGHGQLHARLKDHPRVRAFEGINARELTADGLGDDYPRGGFDLIVCDASFISLALLLPRWPVLLAHDGDVLALVKPQFEVGREGVTKGGIVRDEALYADVERRIRSACADAGLQVLDWFDSPIAGGDGNKEFFIHAKHR